MRISAAALLVRCVSLFGDRRARRSAAELDAPPSSSGAKKRPKHGSVAMHARDRKYTFHTTTEDCERLWRNCRIAQAMAAPAPETMACILSLTKAPKPSSISLRAAPPPSRASGHARRRAAAGHRAAAPSTSTGRMKKFGRSPDSDDDGFLSRKMRARRAVRDGQSGIRALDERPRGSPDRTGVAFGRHDFDHTLVQPGSAPRGRLQHSIAAGASP